MKGCWADFVPRHRLGDVQKILGHHSILTTVRYTHLTSTSNDRAIERINVLMDSITIGWGNVK